MSKPYPTGGLPLALRARQTATPKSFPAPTPVPLLEEPHPRPNSPQKPQPHPRQRKPAAFPQQRQYIACSVNRKSKTKPLSGEYQPQPQQAAGKKGCSYPRERRNRPQFPPLPAKKPGSSPGGNRGLKENPKTNTAPPKPKTRRQPAPS